MRRRGIKQNQTGELLWRDTCEIHWRMLASRSGSILAGYSAGSNGTQRQTRRDPLASYSGILSGILGGIHWRAALVGYSAGSTGEPLWRGRRDALASCSGGILGGIHWRAALAGYSAGFTGELLWRYSAGSTGEQLWRDTRRDSLASCSGDTQQDPLASCSGGILGGIPGELLWRDTGWGRGFQHKV